MERRKYEGRRGGEGRAWAKDGIPAFSLMRVGILHLMRLDLGFDFAKGGEKKGEEEKGEGRGEDFFGMAPNTGITNQSSDLQFVN